MIESLIFSIHFHLGVDYWSDLIIILLFDPSFIIFFPLFSPLSFLYKCVNLFGCSWILRFISLFVWGFVFCAVWPEKYWCYCKWSDLNPRGSRFNSRLWTIRELLTAWSINKQESAQRPPCWPWDQVPPKSQQILVQDTPHTSFNKTGTQPCTLTNRLPKAIPTNRHIKTLPDMNCPSER